jgi:hypothetical protein
MTMHEGAPENIDASQERFSAPNPIRDLREVRHIRVYWLGTQGRIEAGVEAEVEPDEEVSHQGTDLLQA